MDDDRSDYKSPLGSTAGLSGRGARAPMRPQARLRTSTARRGQAESWSPAMEPRRGPSHPDWERPPTQYDYPVLRGREEHRALWPLAAAALGVALVVVVLVIIPMIRRRRPHAHREHLLQTALHDQEGRQPRLHRQALQAAAVGAPGSQPAALGQVHHPSRRLAQHPGCGPDDQARDDAAADCQSIADSDAGPNGSPDARLIRRDCR